MHGLPRILLLGMCVLAWLGGCGPIVRPDAGTTEASQARRSAPNNFFQPYGWLNRLTWGATPALLEREALTPYSVFVDRQLKPGPAVLPAPVQQRIQAMTIQQQPLLSLLAALEDQRRQADALTQEDERKAAQQAYQQELNRLARESATRHVLRALYSDRQVQEQMTWFWLNHFSVFQNKANLRAMVGDYEEHAIRPHALGRFRTLLGAVVQHPAMLRYLDNEQNAAGRLNENLGRELLELHTLGVDGGYSQADVQQMALILTGVGISIQPQTPRVRREWQDLYLRREAFEFNPERHDFADHVLLGRTLRARGLMQLEQALDLLAQHPATARFISRKLAQFWLSDDPAPELIARMSQTFMQTQGDIAQVLRTLFMSHEFMQPAAPKFKDPMRYVISALRLAYDDKPILNAGPVLGWLNRLGQPLYGRQTPDGYPLHQSAWASPGQLTVRFEVARAIGSGSAGLFRSEGPQPVERPAFPQLANALYYQAIRASLSPTTHQALDQAASAQEWNALLLSSPEMMVR